MTTHKIATYKDGFKNVDYCVLCSAEGFQLADACINPEKVCINCGQAILQAHCENCKTIRLNFKKAIDKYIDRN